MSDVAVGALERARTYEEDTMTMRPTDPITGGGSYSIGPVYPPFSARSVVVTPPWPGERYVPKGSEAIEAVQWHHALSVVAADAIASWCGGRIERVSKASDHTDIATILHMPTLDGVERVHHGEWVIKDSRGRFRKMTNDAFVKQYERRG